MPASTTHIGEVSANLAHVTFERIYTKHQLCFLQHERIRKLPPGLLLHRASCLEVRLLSVAYPCKFPEYRPMLVDLTIKLCVLLCSLHFAALGSLLMNNRKS